MSEWHPAPSDTANILLTPTGWPFCLTVSPTQPAEYVFALLQTTDVLNLYVS